MIRPYWRPPVADLKRLDKMIEDAVLHERELQAKHGDCFKGTERSVAIKNTQALQRVVDFLWAQ
jgi:hypothetical protein